MWRKDRDVLLSIFGTAFPKYVPSASIDEEGGPTVLAACKSCEALPLCSLRNRAEYIVPYYMIIACILSKASAFLCLSSVFLVPP